MDVGNVVYLIFSASGFLVGAILLGNVFNKSFVAIANKLKTRGGLVIPAFVFAFVMAYFAAAIHLEAILGAFFGWVSFRGDGRAPRVARASNSNCRYTSANLLRHRWS